MAQNYYRLATLLTDFGSKILTDYLEYHCAYKDLQDLLTGQKHNLHHSSYPEHKGNCCCNLKIKFQRYKITKAQFDALFDNIGTLPPCGRSGTHYCYFKPKTPITLDITLARLLIVNTIPTLSTTDSAAVDEIRKLRNFVAHSPETSISDQEFELKWCASRDNILHLARTLPQPFATEMKNDIDGLKTKSIDSSECMRLLEVVKNIRETDSLLEEIKSEVQGVKEEVHDVKSEVQGAKGAIFENKDEVREVKSEVHEMKGKVQDIKDEVHGVKGAVLENKCEVREVKSEVICLRKDVQHMESYVLYNRANPDEKYMTGIHREPRLKQLIENTAMMLQKHRKKMYVSHKRVMKAAYTGLCKDRHITITGRGGEGKTSLGNELMDKVCNEQTDDEEKYTPVKLDKVEDFDLINGKDHLVIMIDDAFGRTNTDNIRLEEWGGRFEKMSSLIHEGKILIIICIRSSILKDCDDKLRGVEFFSEERKVDLSGNLKLTSGEKYEMLKAFLSQSHEKSNKNAQSSDRTGAHKISDSTLRNISYSDPFYGFPHSCHLFFSSENISDNILDFFKHPDESLQKEIYKLKKNDRTLYTVLVFMLLEGGQFDLNKLKEDKLKELCKLADMQSVDVEDIRDCAIHETMYIEPVDTSKGTKEVLYRFNHQTILESVLLFFCRRNLDIFLKLGKDDQITEFVRPAGYKRTPGEVCFIIPTNCNLQLAKCLVSRQNNLGINILLNNLVNRRLYLDKTFVKDVLIEVETGNVNLFRGLSRYNFRTAIKDANTDLLHFLTALCNRFANYRKITSEDSTTTERALGKLNIPIDIFIDILNCILTGKGRVAVEELLDSSGLDQYLRIYPSKEIHDTGDESGCLTDKCPLDETTRGLDIVPICYKWSKRNCEHIFLYCSYGDPVCYASILGYKNLVMMLIDRIKTVNLGEVTERLMHILTEKDWHSCLQILINKNRKVLHHIDLPKLIIHAIKHGSNDSIFYLQRCDIDLNTCYANVFAALSTLEEDSSFPYMCVQFMNKLMLPATRRYSEKMASNTLLHDIDLTESVSLRDNFRNRCFQEELLDNYDEVVKGIDNVLTKTDISPSLLIIQFASFGIKQIVLYLLQYPIDFTVRDSIGLTLLHYCCEKGWIDIFDAVIEKDKQVLTRPGLSPSFLILYTAGLYCRNHVYYGHMFRYLLQYDIDITLCDANGKTFLDYCCKCDWVHTFCTVLEKYEDVLTKQGVSPSLAIRYAANNCSKNIVLQLLQKDVDLTMCGSTLLHRCCEYGWIDIFEKVVEKDDNLLRKRGLSPSLLILHAAGRVQKGMVLHLLQFDVDGTVYDKNGKTLLHYCCENDWIDVVDKVLEKGDGVLTKQGILPSLLILQAASNEKEEMVIYLLKYKIDFTVCDENSKTLLHYCCENGWVEIYEKVLRKDKELLTKLDFSPSLLILYIASFAKRQCPFDIERCKNVQIVSHLLQYDIDFTLRDKDGKTLLHYCCEKNLVDIVEQILKKDKGVLSKAGLSPSLLILQAATHGCEQMVYHLLEHDIDFTQCDRNGKTLLHYCCENAWIDIFAQVLGKDTVVLTKPGVSVSMLILLAASHDCKQLVSNLFQYIVDLTVYDSNCKTLLHYCCEKDWVDLFDKVLEKDADVLSKQDLSPSLLIVHAARHGGKKMASHLLHFCIDLSVCDMHGKTFLHYCCEHGWIESFDRVVSKNKDVLDKSGLAPRLLILHAASYCCEKMVFHLLQYDVDFTMRDTHGKHLLQYCCENNWVEIVDKILSERQDLITKVGLTPSTLILYASSHNCQQMVSHLLRYEIDFTECDKSSKTLLHYCCYYCWTDIFDKVLEKAKKELTKTGVSLSELVLYAANFHKVENLSHILPAVCNGQQVMVLHMLKYNLDFTVRDRYSKTLLHYCCEKGWINIFDRIIRKVKDVLTERDLSPSLLILHAARYDCKQMVSHLLQYDIDFTICDMNGKTLLHYCCENHWNDVFDKVLETDKDLITRLGLSISQLILYAASFWKMGRPLEQNIQMVSHLLQYDVDFTVRDKYGKTLLHYCCENDWIDIFEKVLEKDADVLTKPGLSPSLLILHAASDHTIQLLINSVSRGYDRRQVISYLLQYEIDFTIYDKTCKTLLHYCCERDWFDIFDDITRKNVGVLSRPDLSPSLLVLHAAKNNKKKMVSHLLSNEIEFIMRDENDKTLLHYCCERDWIDIFDEVIRKDVCVLSKPGLSPSLLILHAAKNQGKKMVPHLLKNEVDFTVRDVNGKTLLHHCCDKNWIDVFGKVLEKDADVLSKQGLTPSLLILHAAGHFCKETVSYLLQYDIDFTMCDKHSKTLLHHCCENNWIDIFNKVLEKEKGLFKIPDLSPSLLILHAASHGCKQLVSHLLQYDVDFTKCDKNSNALLHYCCNQEWIDIFEKVLEKDADVLTKPGLSPSLLIVHAAGCLKQVGCLYVPDYFGRKQMISYLLRYDINLTDCDNNGKTLLHYCCEKGWKYIFDKVLEKQKGLLTTKDLSPSLLILYAASYDCKEMVSHLLQYEIDFTVSDRNGKSLLHHCCEKDWVDIFDRILQKDKKILTEPGLCPSSLILHAAAFHKTLYLLLPVRFDSKHMVSYLLQYPIDFTVRDKNGKTLLHYCCERVWVDIFEKSLKKNPDLFKKSGLSPSLLILHAASFHTREYLSDGYEKNPMVSHLLRYDIDFTMRDKKKKSLLHYCCENDWVDIFDKILEKDPSVLTKAGLSPSQLILKAANYHCKQMVSRLLLYDVDFTGRDYYDMTLLHHCCQNDWIDIFEKILAKDEKVLSKPGISPSLLLPLAANYERVQMIMRLFPYAADSDFSDNS